MNQPFTENDKFELLRSFPNIKLSYDTIVHNKVPNTDLFLIIPEGKKHFVWFTHYKKNNICVLMEITSDKKINNIHIADNKFDRSLTYHSGTILYGTLFNHDSYSFFSIEDMLYYKGTNNSFIPYFNKLKILSTMLLREINQAPTQQYFNSNNSIFLGLPIMNNSFQEIIKIYKTTPYKIKYIQFRDQKRHYYNDSFNIVYDKTNKYSQEQKYQPNSNYRNTNLREKIVFQVKPDIQNDIYHLYISQIVNGQIEYHYYDIAYVPNYNTSVMLNTLFRNIKENRNLDLLEESDDEEEFENDKEDKFVYLDRINNMICEYNYKFKKWTPIKLAQSNDKIISKDEIVRLEKNNY